MKKFYLITSLALISYTSMGFGFPSNTLEQKKTLVLGTNPKELSVQQELEVLEEDKDVWMNDSAVQALVDFIVKYFTFGLIDYIPN